MLIYRPQATKSILKLVAWIDSQNTTGAGEKWFLKLDKELKKLAAKPTELAICKNAVLAKLGYRCFVYKDWVIAYKVKGNLLDVCRFIWGARLQ